jgi:hypothetical protein
MWLPRRSQGLSTIKAGATYFAVVFLFAFVLGTIRVLIVAPHVGETTGVLLETPVILAISWVICRWCVNRFRVASGNGTRLLMGVVAFGLLSATELSVSVFVFGTTIADHFAGFWSSPGIIGLVAQVVFALVPLLLDVNQRVRRPTM